MKCKIEDGKKWEATKRKIFCRGRGCHRRQTASKRIMGSFRETYILWNRTCSFYSKTNYRTLGGPQWLWCEVESTATTATTIRDSNVMHMICCIHRHEHTPASWSSRIRTAPLLSISAPSLIVCVLWCGEIHMRQCGSVSFACVLFSVPFWKCDYMYNQWPSNTCTSRCWDVKHDTKWQKKAKKKKWNEIVEGEMPPRLFVEHTTHDRTIWNCV